MTESFIDRMVKYYEMVSDGDPLFMRVGTAQLLGFLAGYKSNINVTPDSERMNIYSMFVADSYYGRKNVAQDILKEFYPQNKILPNETSAEKFVTNLAENPDGVWFYGEFSKIMKHMNKRHYLSDMAETMNDLYNYKFPIFTRSLMHEDFIIANPYPTLNTTLTPEVLRKYADEEMLDGGLFGRLLLVPGKASDGQTGRIKIPFESIRLRKELIGVATAIYNNKQIREKGLQFEFADDALEELNRIERELASNQAIRAIAGRYGQILIKLAAGACFSREIGREMSYNSKNSINSINSINSKNSISDNLYTNNNIQVSPTEGKTPVLDKCTQNGGSYRTVTIITINTILTINTIITIQDLHEAYEIIKPCLKLAETIKEYVAFNKKHIIKLKKYVEQHHPVLRSIASRYTNLDAKQLKDAEETLCNIQNILKVFHYATIKKNNIKARLTFVYCLEDVNPKKCEGCKYREHCGV